MNYCDILPWPKYMAFLIIYECCVLTHGEYKPETDVIKAKYDDSDCVNTNNECVVLIRELWQ